MLRWDSVKGNGIVIAMYAILTVVLTYPVVANITTHIAGKGDAWSVLWMFWYTKIALLNPSPDLALTYTNFIFYPNGIPMIPFGYAFAQLLSIPLQYLFGLGITYNLLWLFSFIAGGYGTYLLVNYLVDNKIAAFIAGIIFAFCPFHFAHALGHMGATTIEWIPFCALYLLKMTKEGGLKNAVYAAVFFILVAMSDLQYMIYMGFFVVLLVLYEAVTELRLQEPQQGVFRSLRRVSTLKELVKNVMVFASVSVIGILPFTYTMITTALSPSNFLNPLPYETVVYSADLLGFFVPSSFHPLFGSWLSQNVYDYFTGNITEHTTYIGYTVLICSMYAVITLRSKKEVRFWALSAVFFTVMSLGPLLHIYGKTHFTVFETTIPLPYIIIYYIVPFMSCGRTVDRFFVLGMLSFAVLAGFGLARIIKKGHSNRKRIAFVFLLTALLIFEFLAVPCVISFVDKPVCYKQISEDNDDYALLEVPATNVYYCGIKCEYYQTLHGKKIVGGQVARTPIGARDFDYKTPLIQQLVFLKPINDVFLDQNVTEIGGSILNYYDIRYIILHEEYMSEEELEFANNLLYATLKEKPAIYDADGLVVYEVKEEPIKPFMILHDNWHGLENWHDTPTRWMSNNATIFVYSPESRDATILFNVTSFYCPRDMHVYLNDELVYEQEIGFVVVEIPVTLKEGVNVLLFYTPDRCQRPVDIAELKSNDDRCLSLAFQDIVFV